jgi:hypothetical protein
MIDGLDEAYVYLMADGYDINNHRYFDMVPGRDHINEQRRPFIWCRRMP